MIILFGLFSVFILKKKRESNYYAAREGAGPDSHFLSKFLLHKIRSFTKPSSRVTETFQVTELELNLAKTTKCH